MTLEKSKGKRKGFGPLDKWLLAAKSGHKDLGRDEDKPGRKRVRETLGQKVRDTRPRFEEGGEALASSMERNKDKEQDPDLGLDPG